MKTPADLDYDRGLEELRTDEGACAAALEHARWPTGFICPECGGARANRLIRRRLLQCAKTTCRAQTSATAGTPMHATKLPLTQWVRCLRLLELGASVATVARRLRISDTTAWRMRLCLRFLTIRGRTLTTRRLVTALAGSRSKS